MNPLIKALTLSVQGDMMKELERKQKKETIKLALSMAVPAISLSIALSAVLICVALS